MGNYVHATAPTRPPPELPEMAEHWAAYGVRHRMIRESWRSDAEDRLKRFFDRSTWEFLPPAVIAFCPLHLFVAQTVTLYDGPVTVHVSGRRPSAAAMATLGTKLLWPQQSETLEFVRAMNDSYLLRSWDNERRRVRYLPVPPDAIESESDPDDPSQAAFIMHHRRRMIGGSWVWCRDVWDRRDRVWQYRVDAYETDDGGTGRWSDVTDIVAPEVASLPGRWPLWSQPLLEGEVMAEGRDLGKPIWPWTVYHHQVGSRLHNSHPGSELVDGTLVTSVLFTFWLAGTRDVSYEQRVMIDADVGAVASQGQAYTPANPMMVMRVVSKGPDKQGSINSWRSPLDVEKFLAAVMSWVVGLAIHAGLSVSDVSAPDTGLSRVSGTAIEVSRNGKRRIERKLSMPMSIGDAHNLAGAAEIANAYGGTKLPTDPEAYTVVYSETPKSAEEIRAEVEELTRLVDAGLLHPAEALKKMNPHLTIEEAKKLARDIAQFRAELAAIVARAEPAESDDTSDEDSAANGGAAGALDALLELELPDEVRAMVEQMRTSLEDDDTEDEPATPPA